MDRRLHRPVLPHHLRSSALRSNMPGIRHPQPAARTGGPCPGVAPKRTSNPSHYVSVRFAAERAGVSVDTVRRMIADGTLPAYRFRGQIRIAVEDVDAAMRPIN
ncbi:excisionase family DNA-binding protein [Nocardia sp. NPDC057663]|uniref:excisionase family DNA-binding protein n=1 Tax=Nocardia sp. NPDC057663 TaxID=3346201 RepID=UPI00366E8FF4